MRIRVRKQGYKDLTRSEMKITTTITLFVFLLVALSQPPGATSAQIDDKRWQNFYSAFRAAVNTRNKVALRKMMAARFDWAMDGYVSREQALHNIGRMVGWTNFWLSAKKAMATKAEHCTNTGNMNPHSGYCCYARSPHPMAFVFEPGPDGKWYWSAFPGD